MVLELKVPHAANFSALAELLPVFVSYVLSFTFIGIYWNNHHHLFHTVDRVTGGVLWANNHLLFWLSLVPFATGWMGENNFAQVPVIAYGVVLLMAGVAYFVLTRVIVRSQGANSRLATAIGRDWKGTGSTGLLVVGIVLAFVNPLLAFAADFAVAAIWFIPDRRIESMAAKDRD